MLCLLASTKFLLMEKSISESKMSGLHYDMTESDCELDNEEIEQAKVLEYHLINDLKDFIDKDYPELSDIESEASEQINIQDEVNFGDKSDNSNYSESSDCKSTHDNENKSDLMTEMQNYFPFMNMQIPISSGFVHANQYPGYYVSPVHPVNHVNSASLINLATLSPDSTYNESSSEDSNTNLTVYHYFKESTTDVGIDAISDDQSDIDKLLILFAARGKRLEQLQDLIKQHDEDNLKEIRLLTHKLNIAEGNCQSLEKTKASTCNFLDKLETDLKTSKEDNNKLMSENKLFKKDKYILEEKLHKSLLTIEALNDQLVEMNTSETLSRVRVHQQSVVESMKSDQVDKVSQLHDKINSLKTAVEERDSEIQYLQNSLKKFTLDESLDAIKKELFETKLHLFESQKRIEALLSSDNSLEITKLNEKLKKLESAKVFTTELNIALQNEVNELKEQIYMYENKLNTDVNDQQAEIDLKILENTFYTYTNRSLPNLNCVSKLAVKSDFSSFETNVLLQEIEENRQIVVDKTIVIDELNKEISSLKSANESLVSNFEELEKSLQQSLQVTNTLNNRNMELEQQVVQMVSAFENDKKEMHDYLNNKLADYNDVYLSSQKWQKEATDVKALFLDLCSEKQAFLKKLEKSEQRETELIQDLHNLKSHLDCQEQSLTNKSKQDKLLIQSLEDEIKKLKNDNDNFVKVLAESNSEKLRCEKLMKEIVEREEGWKKLKKFDKYTETHSLVADDCTTLSSNKEQKCDKSASLSFSCQTENWESIVENTDTGHLLQQSYMNAVAKIREEVICYVNSVQIRSEKQIIRAQKKVCQQFALHLRDSVSLCVEPNIQVFIHLIGRSLSHFLKRFESCVYSELQTLFSTESHENNIPDLTTAINSSSSSSRPQSSNKFCDFLHLTALDETNSLTSDSPLLVEAISSVNIKKYTI